MEFNETERLYGLFALQRDRNRGKPLDRERAQEYRGQAARCVAVALQYDLPSERAGFEYLCAANMIEAQLNETQAAA
jgi:hypothetical protein